MYYQFIGYAYQRLLFYNSVSNIVRVKHSSRRISIEPGSTDTSELLSESIQSAVNSKERL